MNVGDRVRLLTGREEGIVTRLLDNDLVEVAIDNDFTIPVLRREVVVVAAEEQKAFGQSASAIAAEKKAASTGAANAAKAAKAAGTTPTVSAQKPTAEGPPQATAPKAAPVQKGLYLALIHQSPELLALHLINHTERDVLFTYGEETDAKYRALSADKLPAKTASNPLGHWHLKDFDKWPAAVFQLLPHQMNDATAYELLTKRVQFRAASFYTSRQPNVPVLQREAYLFQLDEKPAAPAVVAPDKLAETLQQQLSGNAPAKPAAMAPPPEPAKAITAPPHEVDLHLEALRPDTATEEPLSNTAILKLQLETFEDTLSRALATNMHEIVFIHGSGNGTLRKELHKLLSRNKDIKFFEDAQKEKFGYGATLVRLK
ncbi:Smr domain-containing protein [Hymenobacter daecheongensis DSM 21074]|uniref:Smr domain-containing protein n=1 Tax=Hymenobacter daecheongensis DSM 21074 TaxID=1121955 RepID=A0A1M6ESA4_9BACT|nr:Smr/MutS family protein [Hymenobacter daecheongensis]SHI88357.1 Smr domain-containing protein [Hymenobacter daecheongensis DSM 21074]